MFRTDLAMEEASASQSLPDGVTMENYMQNGGAVCKITVKTDEAAQKMKKPVGVYVTLDTPSFASSISDCDDEVRSISEELHRLLPPDGSVLIIGLGNLQITPDALGPRCISQIVATRHFTDEIRRTTGMEGIRPVSAIAPGVLGQTGMETGEIVAALAAATKPAAIVAIDALAARSSDRLGRTVQLSDTGISPGSGVFNRRKALNKETLGVPVISMGVPTVVDAATFVEDFLEAAGLHIPELHGIDPDAKGAKSPVVKQGEKENHLPEPLIVTPHQIDLIIERAAKVLALAVNTTLQPDVSLEDLRFLMST